MVFSLTKAIIFGFIQLLMARVTQAENIAVIVDAARMPRSGTIHCLDSRKSMKKFAAHRYEKPGHLNRFALAH